MNYKLNIFPNKLLIIAIYLLSMTVFAIIVGMITIIGLEVYDRHNPNNEVLANTIVNLAIYAFLFFSYLFIINKFLLRQFSLFKNAWLNLIALAIAGWFFSYFLNIMVEMVFRALEFESRDTVNQEQIVESMKYPLLTIPMVVIFAPFVEEIVFRGVVFNAIKDLRLPYKLNLILAIFFSSTLFGLIHVFSVYLVNKDITELILGVPYMVTGFVLTMLYYYSKNIFVPMLAHFFQNTFATFIILIYPYIEEYVPEEAMRMFFYIINIFQ